MFRGAFWQGFRLMLPLWLGLVPFGMAYAVTARAAGLSVWDTQLMSLTVLAGASQFAAAGLIAQGAGASVLILTTLVLNARHLLYSVSLGRELPLTAGQRLLAAQLLTDEAYGVALAQQRAQPGSLNFALFAGIGVSLALVWNLSTLAGALAGNVLPPPEVLGVGVIFSLAFLVLLLPQLTGRREVAVALAAGLGAWGLSQLLPAGLVILLAGVGGALLGAALGPLRETK